MTIGISSSVLLAYLQVKTGQTGTSATTSTGLAAEAPIAPWSAAATSASATTATTSASSTATTALVEKLLAGQPIVSPSAVKLSQTTTSAAANTDYQNLFALYQGLTSLQSLVGAAASTTTTASQLALIQQAFTGGLSQVRSFITSEPFKEFVVSDGTVSTSDETSVAVAQSNDTYDTGPLVTGSPNDVVPGLQGDVSFSLTATNPNSINPQAQPTTVNFNLDNLGSEPRTLANVVNYLNSQLAAAGLKTTFGDNLIPGAAATTTTNGTATTVTPATPDQYGLQINGTPNELLSFSATATPSIYLTQTSSDPTATTASSTTATTTAASATSTTAATTTSQFIKLDPSSTGGSTLTAFADTLPVGAAVQATATAPDGSVYVLANVDSTINGVTVQGQQDAALLKYDSAGQLISTHVLGSAGTVNASAIAVSADGSQVAVAGSITGGTLDPTDTSQNGSSTQQSFVSVYDASGDPLWSSTQDASSDNQANAVSFGTDNTVYVAGSTSGTLPGASSAGGGQNGYLQGFAVTASTDVTSNETTYTASTAFTQEFGSSGTDQATGVTVSGSSVYVSSVENGDAVVRQYAVAPTTKTTSSNVTTTQTVSTGQATLAAKQDLGALAGGDVSGVAVAADGSIIVAGSTHNAALNAGSVTSAYSGNGDAFIASLNPNLSSTSGDALAYYNGGAPTTASALTVSGDTAYITGQLAGASSTTPSLGYTAAIDPTTGAVGWSDSFSGDNGSAAPISIAVNASGASALDLLGLPQGALAGQVQPSQLLTANSSVQAGDYFYVQTGSGAAQKVTIAADDTYATLATKVEQASGYAATVTTATSTAGEQLLIKPANSATSIRIEAGPAGQDALGPLGLREGLVSNAATAAAPTAINGQPVTGNIQSHYSITVPSTLSLSTSAGIAAAQTSLATAVAEVQSIYSDLTTDKSSGTSTSGTVPAYITAQIANYQQALSRLTGSSSSTSTAIGTSSSALALSLLTS